ncbi:hypothetical protein [Streptomyces sp. TP-A0356]|uniref:hypothetical protein n=1 Tax=Streptomyces sp. TP-A0356 TaxID=1359208 RepID=UPI0006E3896D|nr:hypothetical protein [Streptomyces sp. TP-A0356]
MTGTDAGVSAPAGRPWGAPLLSALPFGLGLLGSFGYAAAERARRAAESARCGHVLPISWQMYVTVYAGPLCTLAAVVLAVRALRRSTGARLAVAVLVLAISVLLLLLQGLVLWDLYDDPAVTDPISCA